MEVHQVRYFVEVVRLGNFTRAAERCHVTQPTLSHQIRKLEDELGEPLLQRRKKGTAPTFFGERFYPRALRILEEIESAKEDALSFSTEIRGRLRLGAIPTVAPYLLPALIREATIRYPGLYFEVSEEPTHELLAQMRRGSLDLALVSPPILGEDWNFQKICDDELLVTLPKDHSLAGEKAIALVDIVDRPLVLMKETHCLRGQTLQLCQRAQIEPEVRIESSQLDTVLAMVEIGLGLSITPKMALPFLGGRDVVFRSLAPDPQFRRVSLAWPKQTSRTRAFDAFLQVAGELPEMGPPS
ncbi:LysR family transcriptional regulator [Puniceicoccus vermicola]|uniref:LysR family transcriptional regulator n=1 Tax=Puniceicoccus vermicola TaxID=388746 RepID=A0A7X1AWJ5_9BACT|nr:LysR family transcriptional regulator [Puniceicoccus vermicola]MBC2601291.1 LysR family transcriptional regulator [Puniceicoccus vermicola]